MAPLLWALAAVAAILVLWPYVLYPLSLSLLPRRPLAPPSADPGTGALALVFCAHNEEASLPAKIANCRALKRAWPGLEILAYSDGSTDRTVALLEAAGDVLTLIANPERQGKSAGMNRLVQATDAPVILFSDANVILAEDAPAVAAGCFAANPDLGCLCGHLTYVNADAGATAAAGSLYWRLEEAIKRRETETGSTMGADGSLFAVRRALYRPVPPDIIDDMYVSLSILIGGARVASLPAFRAYEKTAEDGREEWRRKVRIACQAFNCFRLLRPELRRLSALDRYKFVSHKLLRWFGIFFLAAGLLAFAGACLASGLGSALPVLLALPPAALLAAGALSRRRLAGQAVQVLLAMTATGIGLLRSLQGARFQTWATARSGR